MGRGAPYDASFVEKPLESLSAVGDSARHMAQSKTPKTTDFDSVVVGAGLEGLIVAHQLESTGRKVALIEGSDVLGGGSRPSDTPLGPIDLGLKFFPESPETDETLDWLEQVLGEKIERELVDAPPLNYDDGRFKPFVGFGDQKISTSHEVAAYAKGRYYRLSSTPKDWVPKLIETFTGTLMTQSIATKFQVDDEFVIEILVNGSKRISGREILFCATPHQLTRLLPDTHVPAKLRTKLLKGEFWTSVNLDLIHRGQVSESQAIHVLKGANEEPSVGLFHPPAKLLSGPNAGEVAQLSQWMTFVPRDSTDEAEFVASALKQIKRQMKRAYETSLDTLIKERIVVNPTSHGDWVGALNAEGRWPKIQNLWVVSGFLDSARNTVGSLRQARRTLAGLIGEPVEAFAHDTDLSEARQPTI